MMKQEALFKKLGNILNELNEQYEFLAQNPAQLNDVDLELFQATTSFLADHIQIIKKLNLPVYHQQGGNLESTELATDIENQIGTQEDVAIFAAYSEDENTAMVLPQENTLKEIITPEIAEGEPFELEEETTKTFEFILNTGEYDEDEKFEFEEKDPDELFDRSLTAEEELILAEKRQNLAQDIEFDEEDEIGPEPFLVRKEEPIVEQPAQANAEITEPITRDATTVTVENTTVQVQSEYKPTLNDMLSKNNTADRVNDTSGPAISDLKSAINLNDKLLYIKDLFNGYSLAYAEAIDITNKMADFNAADNFLQKNYALKNNWAANQATVDKFYLLLNRRFKS